MDTLELITKLEEDLKELRIRYVAASPGYRKLLATVGKLKAQQVQRLKKRVESEQEKGFDFDS